MFKATREIYQILKGSDAGLKVFTSENEKSSEVWLSFSVKNGSSYTVKYISRDDDNDVALRVFSLIHVEESQKANLYPALNEVNNKYRYVKFVLDGDNDVNVEYDFPVRTKSFDGIAEEMLVRFVQIIDDAYPILMRAMWS